MSDIPQSDEPSATERYAFFLLSPLAVGIIGRKAVEISPFGWTSDFVNVTLPFIAVSSCVFAVVQYVNYRRRNGAKLEAFDVPFLALSGVGYIFGTGVYYVLGIWV